jgi:hypothetical protein
VYVDIYVIAMADMGYGLNRETIMYIVYLIAEKSTESTQSQESQLVVLGLKDANVDILI